MIIGIGGVSRSGKSSMAALIKALYPKKKVSIFCQDDFVFPEGQIPKIDGEVDWECPESIDFGYFHSVLKDSSLVNDIVITEGLLVFNKPEIESLFDKKIFISISEEAFRKRKITDTRWGSFPDWYVGHIWESFMKYGKIKNGRPDFLYVSGEIKFDEREIRDYLEN